MSEADDRAEIIALIHANRIGMWTHDYDLWASCFVHSPSTTRWGYEAWGGTFVRRGWENLSRRVRPVFEGAVTPYSADFAFKTTVENLDLHIAGDMAWAVFDQQYPHIEYDGLVGPGLTHELRIFERHDGHWKIAVLGYLANSGGSKDLAVLELEADGRVRWASSSALRRIEDDDDLVIRNGRLRIRDAACQRRLAAALAWASNLDNGYSARHGSTPVVLGAGEGMPTRVCWIKVEDGSIFFLLDASSMTRERLDLATAIFGLSRAQRLLAGHIADGMTLPEASARMNITPSTARTHLQRIFDKTGVHTQPALVRVLLSVGLPG